MKRYIDELEKEGRLETETWEKLLTNWKEADRIYAAKKAVEISKQYFGNKIYIRGLIEFTSCCKNNCYYCGLRLGNLKAERYRLSEETILDCCKQGYELGFRTFVLQGGEDVWFTDDKIIQLIQRIKQSLPDCAVTLSIGEKRKETYQKFYDAGADRYLLRHETADKAHYEKLHPEDMSFENRLMCLKNLKEIGFQTGCGFMVGSPGQTAGCLVKDMKLIESLHPQMAGIGPFIPHRDTPFAGKMAGDYHLTLFLLSLIRIMEKNILLPATTALGTLREEGQMEGILAGANVVMPNLSPGEVRSKYTLYDAKKYTGEEAAEGLLNLKERMKSIGYEIVSDRGDWKEGTVIGTYL